MYLPLHTKVATKIGSLKMTVYVWQIGRMVSYLKQVHVQYLRSVSEGQTMLVRQVLSEGSLPRGPEDEIGLV